MAEETEKYIKDNTRTSHKRWESMVMYALHYALRNVRLESQYSVPPYLIDGYFPDINLAIEVDEEHHGNQQEEDQERQTYIENKLQCRFERINVFEDSVYKRIDEIVELVKSLEPDNWVVKPKEKSIPNGEYTTAKLQGLKGVNAFEVIDALQKRVEELGVITDVSADNVKKSPITISNGEVGFIVYFDGFTFVVNMTKTLKPKILVTQYSEEVIHKLEFSLSNWKNPNTPKQYKNINEFVGQKSLDDIFNFIESTQKKLNSSL